jgi:hypothetical protein
VPLLEDHEFDLLRVPDLVPRAEALGMRVRRFPIRDVSVPRPGAIEAVGQERYVRGLAGARSGE